MVKVGVCIFSFIATGSLFCYILCSLDILHLLPFSNYSRRKQFKKNEHVCTVLKRISLFGMPVLEAFLMKVSN